MKQIQNFLKMLFAPFRKPISPEKMAELQELERQHDAKCYEEMRAQRSLPKVIADMEEENELLHIRLNSFEQRLQDMERIQYSVSDIYAKAYPRHNSSKP